MAWKVIPSILWQFFGLPDSARWEDEWKDPSPALASVLALLYGTVAWGSWPRAAVLYFLGVPAGTMTPRILMALPAVKAIVRLRKRWPEMYEQLRQLAFWVSDEAPRWGWTSTPGECYFRIEQLLQVAAAWATRRVENPSWTSEWSYRLDYFYNPVEALDSIEGKFERLASQRRALSDKQLYRVRDRLAQNNPKVGEEYPHAYALGKLLAPLYAEIVSFLALASASSGLPIFVHGRDGEIVYHLLRECGVPTAYGITSRAVTTEGCGNVSDYLRRVVPQKAIHYDTGFSGSIPKWMAEKGWDVEAVFLASANSVDGVVEIPGLKEAARNLLDVEGIDGRSLREIVIDYMEHAPQRLEKVRSLNSLTFSDEAPQFWARLAGVRDGLEAL